MALSFPSSPSVGDYYAPGTRVWRWNGTFWEVVTPVQFAKVGNFVETITPTPEGHARLLEGPAVALLVACLLCLSAVSSWAQATVSKVVVDVKMSDGKFQARELTPVANQVIGFDGSGNLVVKAGGSGSGSVTSVAVAGTDGIEVDSGSPITGAGTITLGVNAATMKTTLDLTGTNSGDVTITDTDTIDLGLTGQALTASARTQMSITSDASGLKLSGDAASPGNSKYYGTNSGGTKGYYDLPSGGGSSPTTTQGDMIVRGASVDERLAAPPVQNQGASLTIINSVPAWEAPHADGYTVMETWTKAVPWSSISNINSGNGPFQDNVVSYGQPSLTWAGIFGGNANTAFFADSWGNTGMSNQPHGKIELTNVVFSFGMAATWASIGGLPDATNDKIFYGGLIGLRAAITADPDNGIFWRWDRTGIYGVCRDAGAETTLALKTSGLATNTPETIRCTYDGTNVYWYLNRTYIGSITTNIPTGDRMTFGFGGRSVAGTATRFASVSRVGIWIKTR